MRQIYTSQRLENVDRVIALLGEAGIATHVTNRSRYRSDDYKRFSYADRTEHHEWPAVWIVRAEDQVQARKLLREAGLEPATRYADESALARKTANPVRPEVQAVRARLIVLSALTGAILLLMLNYFQRT